MVNSVGLASSRHDGGESGGACAAKVRVLASALANHLEAMIWKFANGGGGSGQGATLTGNYAELPWKDFLRAEVAAEQLSQSAFPLSSIEKRDSERRGHRRIGALRVSFAARKQLWESNEPVTAMLQQAQQQTGVAKHEALTFPRMADIETWRRTIIAMLEPGSDFGWIKISVMSSNAKKWHLSAALDTTSKSFRQLMNPGQELEEDEENKVQGGRGVIEDEDGSRAQPAKQEPSNRTAAAAVAPAVAAASAAPSAAAAAVGATTANGLAVAVDQLVEDATIDRDPNDPSESSFIDDDDTTLPSSERFELDLVDGDESVGFPAEGLGSKASRSSTTLTPWWAFPVHVGRVAQQGRGTHTGSGSSKAAARRRSIGL